MKAFAGESQARNRYTYFASVARKEGYHQIEAIFLETADNEKKNTPNYSTNTLSLEWMPNPQFR
jgi:rubrerythrin